MENNETIADIIAEMRALSNPISDGIIAINGRSIADRLEAAWKREKATTKKSLAVGDGAKMREALEAARDLLLPQCNGGTSFAKACGETVNKIMNVLAEPPRNCDRFATPEDARKEHHKICEEYGACNKACGYKNGRSGTYQCFERWLFAPATEQKGENNANK